MTETVETDETDAETWSRIRDEKSSQHEEQKAQKKSWADLQQDGKPAWVKELNKNGVQTL
jgi:hypothetical protein